jgi:transcriptional regulator with XRE-family HTH domain
MAGPRRRSSGTGPLGAFATFLGERRRALGLTQRALSELTGVSERTLQHLERGDPGIRVDTLLRVLDGLGLALVVTAPSRAAELAEGGGGATAPGSGAAP